jgi:hypothetical protein
MRSIPLNNRHRLGPRGEGLDHYPSSRTHTSGPVPVDRLAVAGGNAAIASFAATPTGYLAVSGFSPSTDGETYALEITDNSPANLAADLADAAAEINAGTYTGYTLTASTTDPLTILNSGYDFYITIGNDTLGTGSPYFGFDFTQLNGTTDTLSVTAVAAVPEPASLAMVGFGCAALLRRRRWLA